MDTHPFAYLDINNRYFEDLRSALGSRVAIPLADGTEEIHEVTGIGVMKDGTWKFEVDGTDWYPTRIFSRRVPVAEIE